MNLRIGKFAITTEQIRKTPAVVNAGNNAMHRYARSAGRRGSKL